MRPDVNSAARTLVDVDVDSPVKESVTPFASLSISGQSFPVNGLDFDYAEYSSQQLGDVMSQLLERNFLVQKSAIVLEWLAKNSVATGGAVQLKPEFYFCPVLIGSDGAPVALYELVETIDGLINYDKIKEELPSLSYNQIYSAIAFLRKAAQFNITGRDIDDLEDEELAQDEELIAELKRALADQEITRVLNPGERDV
jgi:hypothetical protein